MTVDELRILLAFTETWNGDPLGPSAADEIANRLSRDGTPRRAQGVATQLRGLKRRGLVTSRPADGNWQWWSLTDWGLKVVTA